MNIISNNQNEKLKKKRIKKYTLAIFLEKAKEVHGEKYNYSRVTEGHINGIKSHIPIKCNICEYEWSPTIGSHINNKNRCPDCAGRIPWTLERFLVKAREINNEKYDYSQITENHINGFNSHIPIKCRKCNYKWSPTIGNHINARYGCPNCAGNANWTLERFLVKAQEIHGSKYDYSGIIETHINGLNSNIPIKCRKCDYEWNPTINHHINSRSGCPRCVGHVPWTLEQVLMKARNIHGDKYDYSQIIGDDINGAKSRIPIKCNKCSYKWDPTINHHINDKSGCPNCSGTIPWTLERFLIKAEEIHGDKYDYSQITKEYIDTAKSHIPIKCKTCGYKWNPSIHNHINSKTGCPRCSVSRGYSNAQIKWLDNIMKEQNISIQYALSSEGEYKIPEIGKIDGYCVETNTVYEFHGDYWHGNPEIYDSNDINKVNGKTFGELYQKTLERDQKIRDKRYNLIVMWECDFSDK